MAKVIVVYGGGFQPFHAGHLSSYLEAKQAFPNADFYVAASNDTKTRPIPFDDKQYLAQQAGVTDPFVQVKMPINPTEILDRYSPKKDIFILVRSERDPVGYTKKDGSPGYYQPFTDITKCQPFGYHGYVFVTHKKDFKLNGQDVYSGTQVRDMYMNSDDKGRQNIVQQLYPRSQEQDTVKQMLDKYIGSQSVEPAVAKPAKSAIKSLQAKKLKEHIQRMRPLLREATVEQKYKLLKLMKEAAQLDELNLFGKKPTVTSPKKSMNYDEIRRITRATGGPQQKVYRSPEEYLKAQEKKPQLADENVASGINKMFNNLGDPVYSNLQRVALLAMQGRQQEAASRLNSVIKDANPDVQKKIIGAVNNIKPVTINGKIADSSTLDKSKQHQDWILNTFIPWVQSLLGQQGVAEAVHPDVTSKKYFIDPTENIRMGDFVFNARTFTGALEDNNAKGLQIRAYDPKNLKSSIGSADFIVKSDKKGNTWLESDDTEVNELYQGKGVAAMMYAFAKSLGNDIKDSPYQSAAGSNMWRKWGSDADNLMREDYLPEK